MKTQNFNSQKNLLLVVGIMVAMIISITSWIENSSAINQLSSSTQVEIAALNDFF